MVRYLLSNPELEQFTIVSNGLGTVDRDLRTKQAGTTYAIFGRKLIF
jgi:hypothetical protein